MAKALHFKDFVSLNIQMTTGQMRPFSYCLPRDPSQAPYSLFDSNHLFREKQPAGVLCHGTGFRGNDLGKVRCVLKQLGHSSKDKMKILSKNHESPVGCIHGPNVAASVRSLNKMLLTIFFNLTNETKLRCNLPLRVFLGVCVTFLPVTLRVRLG